MGILVSENIRLQQLGGWRHVVESRVEVLRPNEKYYHGSPYLFLMNDGRGGYGGNNILIRCSRSFRCFSNRGRKIGKDI